MLFPEFSIALLFVLFLTIFVLIGIYPAFKRAANKLRQLRQAVENAQGPAATLLDNLHTELFARTPTTGPLNDFEIIVLRRIARTEGKALSRKQVNAPLHFGAETLHKTLRSLNRRGLVQLRVSVLFGPRFTLSAAGRQFAVDQGYILHLQRGRSFSEKSSRPSRTATR